MLGVRWHNGNLQCLDQWIIVGDQVFITDFPTVRLSLAELLPHIPEHKKEQDWHGTIDLPQFDGLLQALLAPIPCTTPDLQVLHDRLPQKVLNSFEDLLIDPMTGFDEIRIYTDGSYSLQSGLNAGWSLVVLGTIGTNQALIDCEWGVVDVDPLRDGWTAATLSDAKAAEGQAMVRALEWCFRNVYDIPIWLCFDSQQTGYSGAGHYSIGLHDKQLRLLRGLVHGLQQRSRAEIRWKYVPGHSGCLGNEMADILAKCATERQEESWNGPRPDYMPFLFGDKMAIDFFWLFCKQGGQMYPPLSNGSLVLQPLEAETGIQGRVPAVLHEEQPKMNDQVKLKLKVATYNVTSLRGKKCKYINYLREQTASHQIDVLFLQETRSPKSQLVTSSTHVRVSAAAEGGHGGVETWLGHPATPQGQALNLTMWLYFMLIRSV